MPLWCVHAPRCEELVLCERTTEAPTASDYYRDPKGGAQLEAGVSTIDGRVVTVGGPGISRTLPTLVGHRLALRPGAAGDEPALGAVFDAPEVARWWPSATDDDVRDLVHNRDPDADVWLVEVDGRVVGMIQAYEETDPMYRHAGIDIVLHPDVHGQGVGPEAIRVLARHLFDDRGHHRIVIDPNAANSRAIHVYEKVGFRRVGVLREYEWDASLDRWTDGVLMDLLRGELV